MSVIIPSHSSFVGSKWQAYWAKRNKNGHDEALLPVCDIAFKVYEVGKLDAKAGTFDTVFVLMLDWLDPSLERNEMSDEERAHDTIDWSQHFVPRIELLDCIRVDTESQDNLPRVRPKDKSGECNHCTLTIKFSATVKSRFDFRQFPFEKQVLEISLKTHTISDGIEFTNKKASGAVQLNNPARWRSKQGHSITDEADWLADWDIVGLGAGRISRYRTNFYDGYKAQIIVQRNAKSIMYNMVLSLAVIGRYFQLSAQAAARN